jgi:hypothetical protein
LRSADERDVGLDFVWRSALERYEIGDQPFFQRMTFALAGKIVSERKSDVLSG